MAYIGFHLTRIAVTIDPQVLELRRGRRERRAGLTLNPLRPFGTERAGSLHSWNLSAPQPLRQDRRCARSREDRLAKDAGRAEASLSCGGEFYIVTLFTSISTDCTSS
jgi:hypothetical protein